jgi:hypothetical protein
MGTEFFLTLLQNYYNNPNFSYGNIFFNIITIFFYRFRLAKKGKKLI